MFKKGRWVWVKAETMVKMSTCVRPRRVLSGVETAELRQLYVPRNSKSGHQLIQNNYIGWYV